jgi:hypothetical protein
MLFFSQPRLRAEMSIVSNLSLYPFPTSEEDIVGGNE